MERKTNYEACRRRGRNRREDEGCRNRNRKPRDAETELLIMEYQKNAKPDPTTLKVLEFFWRRSLEGTVIRR